MTSVAHEDDARFNEAEADVERGEPWRYRDPDAPNPLTIEVTGWSTGHTKIGDAEFLNGVDRDGKPWAVLVGSVVLRKRLVEGLVEEWDDDEGAFVVRETLGRVKAGEVVSLKYLGDGESSSGNSYPRFAVSRKPPASRPQATADEQKGGDDDGIPF
jgi:hypothetical protein